MLTTTSSQVQKFLEEKGAGFEFITSDIKKQMKLHSSQEHALTAHVSRLKSRGAIEAIGTSIEKSRGGKFPTRYRVLSNIYISTRETPRNLKKKKQKISKSAKTEIYTYKDMMVTPPSLSAEQQLSELFLDIASKFEKAEKLFKEMREQRALESFSTQELAEEIARRVKSA